MGGGAEACMGRALKDVCRNNSEGCIKTRMTKANCVLVCFYALCSLMQIENEMIKHTCILQKAHLQ